jgi:hypothetical protein
MSTVEACSTLDSPPSNGTGASFSLLSPLCASSVPPAPFAAPRLVAVALERLAESGEGMDVKMGAGVARGDAGRAGAVEGGGAAVTIACTTRERSGGGAAAAAVEGCAIGAGVGVGVAARLGLVVSVIGEERVAEEGEDGSSVVKSTAGRRGGGRTGRGHAAMDGGERAGRWRWREAPSCGGRAGSTIPHVNGRLGKSPPARRTPQATRGEGEVVCAACERLHA